MISHIRNANGRTLSWMMSAAAVAVVVGQLLANWLNLCGTSLDSLAAVAIGFSIGVILVRWIADRMPPHFMDGSKARVVPFLFALTLITLSWLAPKLLNVTLLAGGETIGTAWPISTTLTMVFPALVIAMITAAAGLFFRTANPRPDAYWIDSSLTGAQGVIVLLIPVWLGWPAMPLAGLATLMTGLALVTKYVQHNSDPSSQDVRTVSADSAVFAAPAKERYSSAFSFAASGMLIVAITEILCRLFPGDLPVLIQTVCLTALALAVLSRPLTTRLLTRQGMQFLALLTLALLPVVFLRLAYVNLAINTGGLPAWCVLWLRSLQSAVFATAVFLPAVCISRDGHPSISAQTAILPLGVGTTLGLAVLSQGVSPIMLLAAGIVVHAAAQMPHVFAVDRDRSLKSSPHVHARSFVMSGLSLSSACLVALGSVETSRTSSLLFSERTVAAVERGVAQDLIAQSHANRLMTTVPTSSGEVTVWRRTGNVLEFQRNGIPIGRISTDTDVSPQPAEDILPAILPLANHAQPSRVLLLGDDTGVCLRTCSHFPIQEIVAIRRDCQVTELAHRFTWNRQQQPPDQDERVQILHEPAMLALRRRELHRFDVVIASGDSVALPAAACQFTAEFYHAVHSRMNADAVFCQRFHQSDPGPEPLKAVMATLMTEFTNVGVIQTMPGEILLLASDSDRGLIDPDLLSRLQRDHVRREIATTGWDWAQIAILPMLDARDPIGLFSHETPPRAISAGNCGLSMAMPYETIRAADRQVELQMAFGPHQQQILAAVPSTEDHQEVKRRMSALAQQLEILAGMPDQPWTYRKSLQMEMKQSPRPPRDLVESGKISKIAHPLDLLRQQYFISLGKALKAASRGELNVELINGLDTFTEDFEPLITHFAHYEIVRLHELSQHPAPVEEFRHRLHIVFFTSSTDASVRPVISAMQQLADQPSLIADDTERYDMLNSLLQKMIERWEARTAWEPRSALRVQNDVEMSVDAANHALALMESVCDKTSVKRPEFYQRRRFVNAALIKPLRDYRDQVLAHRMKAEKPVEQNTEDPHDIPLLINSSSELNTN